MNAKFSVISNVSILVTLISVNAMNKNNSNMFKQNIDIVNNNYFSNNLMGDQMNNMLMGNKNMGMNNNSNNNLIGKQNSNSNMFKQNIDIVNNNYFSNNLIGDQMNNMLMGNQNMVRNNNNFNNNLIGKQNSNINMFKQNIDVNNNYFSNNLIGDQMNNMLIGNKNMGMKNNSNNNLIGKPNSNINMFKQNMGMNNNFNNNLIGKQNSNINMFKQNMGMNNNFNNNLIGKQMNNMLMGNQLNNINVVNQHNRFMFNILNNIKSGNQSSNAYTDYLKINIEINNQKIFDVLNNDSYTDKKISNLNLFFENPMKFITGQVVECNLNELNKIITIYNDAVNKQSTNHPIQKNLRNVMADYENTILNKFTYPQLVGLDNVGSTCYMNASLQCLFRIPYLPNYFLTHDVSKEQKLSYLCSQLVNKMWDDSYSSKESSVRSFSPSFFKQGISNINIDFAGNVANDSKDFIDFIIMRLSSELNNPNASAINTNIGNNRYSDFKIALNTFLVNFKRNCSVISDIFFSIFYSTTHCNTCSANSYNFQTNYIFTFSLEDIRRKKVVICADLYLRNQGIEPEKFKKNQAADYYNILNAFNNRIKTVSIYECFNYEGKKSRFEDANNSLFCNKCKSNQPAYILNRLYVGSDILIIQLDRGKGLLYNDVNVDFSVDVPELLDLYNFTYYKGIECRYKLVSFIVHIGDSGQNGHFVAVCKDHTGYSWHLYNDSNVLECNLMDYLTINNELKRLPYILFYQRCNNNEIV